MKEKTTYTLLLTLLISVLLSSVLPLDIPVAFADEATDKTPTTYDDGTLSVVETYSSSEDEPELPRVITRDGQRYKLEETAVSINSGYERPFQHFTRTAFSQVPLEGINNLAAYFPATIVIDEGEYQGEIGLDPTMPYTIVNRYEIIRQQVDRTQVFTGFPDNDVTRLPTSYSFEVSSAAAPGATEIKSLQMLDVSYDIAGVDYLGLPNNYTATVTYRGQEEYLSLVHYDVTANYSGDVVSSVDQMTVTGTYSPVAETEVIEEYSNTPLAEPEIPLFPLVIASTMVVVLLALPLLFFFFMSNARFFRVVETNDNDGEGKSDEKNRPLQELICRRRLVLKDGIANFRIPPDIDIFDGDDYCLAIKPRLADREGEVMFTWQDKVVAVLPLGRHININFRELLTSSVEAILMETDLVE